MTKIEEITNKLSGLEKGQIDRIYDIVIERDVIAKGQLLVSLEDEKTALQLRINKLKGAE